MECARTFGLWSIVILTLGLAAFGAILCVFFNQNVLSVICTLGFLYLLVSIAFFQIIKIKPGYIIIYFVNPVRKNVAIPVTQVKEVFINNGKRTGGPGLVRIFTSDDKWLTLSTMMLVSELQKLSDAFVTLGIKVNSLE